MTEFEYLASTEAAYVRSFEARVIALPPGGVVLDRTFFYPAGGGQPFDTGQLGPTGAPGLGVIGVERSGSEVIHRLARKDSRPGVLRIGAGVTGTIDWPRRYAHMRAHTAQHLLSARLFERTGRRTRSARLSAAAGSILLEPSDRPLPDPHEVVRDLEAWVARGVPVTIRFLPRSEYELAPGVRSGLLPLPAHVDPVRVVEISAVDRCPCGGTHLRSTLEIGPVTVRYVATERSGEARVEFALGAGPDPAIPPG